MPLPQAVHGLPTFHTVPTLFLPLTYISAANPLKLCHSIKSPCNLKNSIYSLPGIETLKQAQWLSILRTSSGITVSMGIDLFFFLYALGPRVTGGMGTNFLSEPSFSSWSVRVLQNFIISSYLHEDRNNSLSVWPRGSLENCCCCCFYMLYVTN